MLVSRSTYTTEEGKRLRELILYVAEKSASDPKFGLTKLNKILLAADVLAFLKRRRTISGSDYKALEYGPAPVGMRQILDRMEADKELVIQMASYHGKPQKRPINLRRAVLDGFTGDDIRIIDEVIGDCRDFNATAISEASHGIAYDLAIKSGKPLRMDAFLFKQKQKIRTYHEVKLAKLVAERGW